MMVECRGGKSVRFEFTEAPNLTNATPESGGYSRISHWSVVDGEYRSLTLIQNWGSKTISVRDSSDEYLNSMLEEPQFGLWLKWYGTDGVLFSHDMTGAKEAVGKLPC